MELPGFVASKKWIFKNCGEMMWFHMYILRPVSTYLHFFFEVGPHPSKKTSTIWIKNRTLEG